uniref:Uteroglobin n=1 Tax=Phascolarctos cinereus TaxID=38626 RepID=A0A6P5INE5_PHACI|nr:uteroglobin [Phascolarctos cinereus]
MKLTTVLSLVALVLCCNWASAHICPTFPEVADILFKGTPPGISRSHSVFPTRSGHGGSWEAAEGKGGHPLGHDQNGHREADGNNIDQKLTSIKRAYFAGQASLNTKLLNSQFPVVSSAVLFPAPLSVRVPSA